MSFVELYGGLKEDYFNKLNVSLKVKQLNDCYFEDQGRYFYPSQVYKCLYLYVIKIQCALHK